MKNVLAAFGLLSACAASAAIPSVGNLSVTVAPGSRTVEIGYDLSDADAIVTLDVETNCTATGEWVSIGAGNITHAVGDVWRLVNPGEGRKIYWCSEKSWPGHEITSPDQIRVVVKAVATNTPPNYMVCDIVTGDRTYYDEESQLPGGIDSDDYRKHLLLFRKIPARGKVMRLGTNPVQASYKSDYDRQFRISFTNDYYMGVFEVTQWQFNYTMQRGNWTPYYGKYVPSFPGDTRPFDSGGWGAASLGDGSGTVCPGYGIWGTGTSLPEPTGTDDDYTGVSEKSCIGQLRIYTGLGLYLHLPTQWQWEFACRAGCEAEFCNGGSVSNANEVVNASLDLVGRYKGNGGYIDNGDGTYTAPEYGSTDTSHGTARVGSYAPNAWGLYDMHGNVREWCKDCRNAYHDKQFKDGDIVYFNPRGEDSSTWTSTYQNYRGGAWNTLPASCTSGFRGGAVQAWGDGSREYGFRLCYTIK